ncbi:MAG: rhomboid family intramembrane serine protease [Catenulisporales bacterium]|jgi:membrane associated rhomboid family serine protease|nr:rhomboid family intramembrane serine protease [Catenulisporales bacterium]
MSEEGSWDGRSAEAVLYEARKALYVMVGFIALIWAAQVVNSALDYRLSNHFGIVPRSVGHLGDIFSAPFLHYSWQHIESNSGPLFVFGFLAAYRGVRKFLMVTLVIVCSSGLMVWFAQGNSNTVGASGLVYGYFSYVVVKGLFDRHLVDVLIGCVMALSYAYLLTAALPGVPHVSWLGHLGGAIGGVLAGWLLRERGAAAAGSGFGLGLGLGAREDREVTGPGRLGDTAILPPTPSEGGRKKSKGGSLPGSPRSDLLKELDDLGL